MNAVADEFHRFIQRAVHADQTDDVQDNVLAADVFCGFVFEHELDRGRDFEPRLAAHHARRHVRRADARRECAECAVSAGVAVRADDEVARADQTLFGQEGVFDAHSADVEEIIHAVFVCEVADGLDLFRRFDVLVRGEVVHDHAHLCGAFDAGKSRLFKFLYCNGRCDVVAENHIQFGIDELTRFDAFQPRVCREDLLRHCHSHNREYLLVFKIFI